MAITCTPKNNIFPHQYYEIIPNYIVKSLFSSSVQYSTSLPKSFHNFIDKSEFFDIIIEIEHKFNIILREYQTNLKKHSVRMIIPFLYSKYYKKSQKDINILQQSAEIIIKDINIKYKLQEKHLQIIGDWRNINDNYSFILIIQTIP